MNSVISFYSYKGGTGRTTSCANVAYQLAQLGNKVLCIDLDIDGPGLHAVFGLENSPELETKNIVRFFEEGTPNYHDFIHDLTKTDRFSVQGQLHIVPAIMGVHREDTLETMGTDLPSRLHSLIKEVQKEYDYVILDTASGVSEYSLLAFTVSNQIVVCFKWSKQHVIGTLRVATVFDKMKAADDKKYPLKNWFLVPTSVSPPQNEYEESRKRVVLDVIKEHLRMDLDLEIPENSRQKWEESILIDKNGTSDSYNKLAEMLST